MSVSSVKAALNTKLRGDATLTGYLNAGTASVYQNLAAQGDDAPYVIFQKQAGTPDYTFTGKAFDNDLYMVKAVTQGHSPALAGTIADRIDAVLTDGSLTISGGTHYYLRREADIDYTETGDGVTYHHIGASYRVWSS